MDSAAKAIPESNSVPVLALSVPAAARATGRSRARMFELVKHGAIKAKPGHSTGAQMEWLILGLLLLAILLAINLERHMSAEFDALKVQVASIVTAVDALVAKVQTSPDPPPAEIVAAADQLKAAADKANAALNPPA